MRSAALNRSSNSSGRSSITNASTSRSRPDFTSQFAKGKPSDWDAYQRLRQNAVHRYRSTTALTLKDGAQLPCELFVLHPTERAISSANESGEWNNADHINRILSSTESARFAVGHFFLSGLESIAQRLSGVKELRLLIGNTTNRETLQPLAEGYRRLELVAEAAEAEAYPKRTDTKRIRPAQSARLG